MVLPNELLRRTIRAFYSKGDVVEIFFLDLRSLRFLLQLLRRAPSIYSTIFFCWGLLSRGRSHCGLLLRSVVAILELSDNYGVDRFSQNLGEPGILRSAQPRQ